MGTVLRNYEPILHVNQFQRQMCFTPILQCRIIDVCYERHQRRKVMRYKIMEIFEI